MDDHHGFPIFATMDVTHVVHGMSTATPVDLSSSALSSLGIDPTDDSQLSPYIFNGDIRYGGYGEQRSLYERSPHFSGEEARDIHLGLDIWVDQGTAVHAPWDGVVVGAYDNVGIGDYGPTIILAHRSDDEVIHSLFGHLDRLSLDNWSAGDKVLAGEVIAEVGSPEENGGWLPHLHFQLIKDLQGNTIDYPGVCHRSEWEVYRENCPDPTQVMLLD